MEIWKSVVGVPTHEVSDLGRVRNASTKELITQHCHNGYRTAMIGSRKTGTRKNRRVNRIVCTAFHGPAPSPEHHAAHNYGDRENNAASNLRWATAAENSRDKIAHGTTVTGADHPSAGLTPEKVAVAELALKAGLPKVAIAAALEVSDATVGKIARGKSQYGTRAAPGAETSATALWPLPTCQS